MKPLVDRLLLVAEQILVCLVLHSMIPLESRVQHLLLVGDIPNCLPRQPPRWRIRDLHGRAEKLGVPFVVRYVGGEHGDARGKGGEEGLDGGGGL